MKTAIVFILLLFSHLFGFAQDSLTIGEVHDFEIGDIFQTSYSESGYQGPPYYTKKEVIAKEYSTNSDSITYTFHVTKYRAAYGIEDLYQEIYDQQTTYTNLDSTAGQFALYSAAGYTSGVVTSSSYNFRRVYYFNTNYDNVSFEPNSSSSSVIEGCGGPYYSASYGFGGQGYTKSLALIYYKKGGEEYGNLISNIDEATTAKKSIMCYPNPSKGHIKILGLDVNEVYGVFLFDVVGRRTCVGQMFDNTLDISSVDNGFYSLVLTAKDGSIITSQNILKMN